jgi:hypothetical protein
MNNDIPAILVPARFGRSGSKVHRSYGWPIERHGRIVGYTVGSSVPACGTYARPGAGMGLTPGTEITCTKCAAI